MKRRRLGLSTRASAVGLLLMLLALVAVLTSAAMPSVRTFGFSFLFTSEWRPNDIERPKVGPDGKVVMEDGEVVLETLPARFGALPVILPIAPSPAAETVAAEAFTNLPAWFFTEPKLMWLAVA